MSIAAASPLADTCRFPERTTTCARDFIGAACRYLLLATPAVLIGWLIFLYGVDTPWGDQWDGMAQLFEKAQAGTLGLSDFFAFHNEHRIFFPRLIMFATARLTNWNVRAEMLIGWMLLCVSAMSIRQMAKASGWRDLRSCFWLILASNVLLFTPLQWENLIWGFQIGFLLPLAATITALWLATALPRPFDFVGTMILCLVTTFSIASGFSSWLLVAPVLALTPKIATSRTNFRWWLIWILIACASTYFYFRGFAQPHGHPSEQHGLSHPLDALEFFLAYLGSPFSSGTAFDKTFIAEISGGALLVSLLALLSYLWHCRSEKELLGRAVPWVSLGGIALANALLTTIGRVGFGISAALPPRYVSFSIMLPLALLFLGALVLQDGQARFHIAKQISAARLSCAIFASVFGLLFLLASIHCLNYWSGFQHKRLLGKSALTLSEVLDESEGLKSYVHWSSASFHPRMRTLDQLGYLHPPLLRTRQMSALAADPGGETFGQLTNSGRKDDGDFAAGGWAILPRQHRIADSVLLAYQNERGEWILFARADVGSPLPAVSQALEDETYRYSGWLKSWAPEQLPAGTRRISAWAYDADAARAFQIGEASIAN